MSTISRMLLLLTAVAFLSGCVQFRNQRGIEVAWQDEVVARLQKGESTRADVLALLGPPSQVIALEDETVLYYLFEDAEGDGLLLIVYNNIKIQTHYDRAIFFFDENDVLSDYATQVRARDSED
ncbi:MAG: outer membrane protein assembly factor BamE [Halieaceae bacterium]|nr:outer membrane protein assembly factor BamE [Halieaceae bacterium]